MSDTAYKDSTEKLNFPKSKSDDPVLNCFLRTTYITCWRPRTGTAAGKWISVYVMDVKHRSKCPHCGIVPDAFPQTTFHTTCGNETLSFFSGSRHIEYFSQGNLGKKWCSVYFLIPRNGRLSSEQTSANSLLSPPDSCSLR